jgi:transcriptional regulator with XRE-family HTH domain
MADFEKWKRVGERVGALIRIRGYKTVELFAHENGIDKSVLNRLIRGKREVRLSTFLKILDALEISVPELYAGTGLVREKEPGYDARGGKAKRPEAGGRVFRFTRDEFDRIEIRKTARDKSPAVMESEGKKSRSLAVRTKSLRLEL